MSIYNISVSQIGELRSATQLKVSKCSHLHYPVESWCCVGEGTNLYFSELFVSSVKLSVEVSWFPLWPWASPVFLVFSCLPGVSSPVSVFLSVWVEVWCSSCYLAHLPPINHHALFKNPGFAATLCQMTVLCKWIHELMTTYIFCVEIAKEQRAIGKKPSQLASKFNCSDSEMSVLCRCRNKLIFYFSEILTCKFIIDNRRQIHPSLSCVLELFLCFPFSNWWFEQLKLDVWWG